jgi:hypothetical protein
VATKPGCRQLAVTPVGEQVEIKFMSAIQDIEEAGKCLAMGRGTATVFHLMRVVEALYSRGSGRNISSCSRFYESPRAKMTFPIFEEQGKDPIAIRAMAAGITKRLWGMMDVVVEAWEVSKTSPENQWNKAGFFAIPFPNQTGTIMADNPDTSPSKVAVIPVSDAPHAPFIFYEWTPAFGYINGVINLTLLATRTCVGPDGVVRRRAARIKCHIQNDPLLYFLP